MTDKNKPKILVITGPTAVGKSAVAVRIAKEIGAEILSADSMQIYRGFNIGTGKITEEESCGVSHRLIDIAEPDENYTVGRYVQDAYSAITTLFQKNIPIVMTGGTGLYINALINGYNFAETGSNEELRERFRAIAESEGFDVLYRMLCDIDPESAKKISPNDSKRIIRALEIQELTGGRKSERIAENAGIQIESKVLVLTCERQQLYTQINRRVDSMIASGLEREVRSLSAYRHCGSMQAIGYKEFMDYIDGTADFDETVELIKKRSRNYAKRQMTYFRWFKADKEFIDASDFNHIMQKASEFFGNCR